MSTKVYPPNPHIDPAPFFSQPDACQGKLFSHRMLASPLRQVVIAKIKDPLRVALENAKGFPSLVILFWTILMTAWRIRKHVGKVTKYNSVYKLTHVILDLAGVVKECHLNSARAIMMNSALEILAAVNEHDRYYQTPLMRSLQYIIKKVEAGELSLEPDPLHKDIAHCWNEKRLKAAVESIGG